MSCCCYKVLLWLFTVLSWGAIAFIVTVHTLGFPPMVRIASIATLSVTMLTYYILALCSDNFRYIRHRTDAGKIYTEMAQLLSTPPRVVMHIACYHNETRTSHSHSKHGTQSHSHTVRVYTHSASQGFAYRSWRDISGTFRLDLSAFDKGERIAYVKLHLTPEVTFSNDGSGEDFAVARSQFVAVNRRDVHQSYTEQLTVDGLRDNIMVQISDSTPCCIRPALFLFWCTLTLYPLYMLYVDSYCSEQSFSVRKVVSTRRDLNAGPVQQQLSYYDPRILARKQTVVFAPRVRHSTVYFVPAPYYVEKEEKSLSSDSQRTQGTYVPPAGMCEIQIGVTTEASNQATTDLAGK